MTPLSPLTALADRLARALSPTVQLAGCLGALLTLPLVAHIPVFLTRENAARGRSPVLPDGTVSFAFYGAVDGPADSRQVRAALETGQQVFAELLVPNLAPERDLDDEALPGLTIDCPDGTRRTVTATKRSIFEEPYTDTSYVSYAVERFPADAGTYAFTVEGKAPARFVLAVGEDERPGDVQEAEIGTVEDVAKWYAGPVPTAEDR